MDPETFVVARTGSRKWTYKRDLPGNLPRSLKPNPIYGSLQTEQLMIANRRARKITAALTALFVRASAAPLSSDEFKAEVKRIFADALHGESLGSLLDEAVGAIEAWAAAELASDGDRRMIEADDTPDAFKVSHVMRLAREADRERRAAALIAEIDQRYGLSSKPVPARIKEKQKGETLSALAWLERNHKTMPATIATILREGRDIEGKIYYEVISDFDNRLNFALHEGGFHLEKWPHALLQLRETFRDAWLRVAEIQLARDRGDFSK